MSDEQWEVVNTKQKKQQKLQKKRDDKESQKKKELLEKQEEERKRKAAEDAFLQQYVLAKQTNDEEEDTTNTNMFDAFKAIEKKQRRLAINDMLLPQSESDEEESGAPGSSKKKVKKAPKPKKPSVQKVAKQIDNKQLKDLLAQYSAKYPDNYEIQLKNLAEQFETIFNTADSKKERLANSSSFPYSYLEKDVLDTVHSFMAQMPEESLNVFFNFLLTTLLSVNSKSINTSGLGLKLLLQILAKHFPQTILKNLSSIKTLGSDSVPTLLYVFNQFLTEKGVKYAFSAWFHVLLNLLFENKVNKEIKESIINYFESAMEISKNVQGIFSGDSATGVLLYEKILLEKSLPERIAKYKNKLLNTSFLFGKQRVPKKLFTVLLSHAASSRVEFREEILQKCVDMFKDDANCYSYWKDSYGSYIAESNNLMLFMTLHWEEQKLGEKFKTQEMFEVLKSFTKINKQMLAGDYVNPDKKDKKPKKLSKEQVGELTTVNATIKALKSKLVKYNKVAGNANNVLVSVLPVAVIVAGAAAYTILNCCNQEWCSSIDFMNQLLKCNLQ